MRKRESSTTEQIPGREVPLELRCVELHHRAARGEPLTDANALRVEVFRQKVFTQAAVLYNRNSATASPCQAPEPTSGKDAEMARLGEMASSAIAPEGTKSQRQKPTHRQILRERIRRRFAFRCGYCGIGETETGGPLTIDHYHPKTLGGKSSERNLVYCCYVCNALKGDYWSQELPLKDDRALRPLRFDTDDIARHIAIEDNCLLARTERGRFHIALFQLNHSERLRPRIPTSRELFLAGVQL